MERNSDRFGRFEAFVIESVAPRLVFGKRARGKPSMEELERQAQGEIDAQIGMGRPAPEPAVGGMTQDGGMPTPEEQLDAWRREHGLHVDGGVVRQPGLAPVLPLAAQFRR